MLKILKSTDPIEITTLILTLYGDPGAGKTSLGFSAADPLLLDFDKGAHRSHFRRDSVPVEKWPDVAKMDADDLAPYQTIVVDTVGRALDAMAVDIMAGNPKMKGPGGGLTLQGFGALKSRFADWMRDLRSYGKDVILIAHGVEKGKGDDVILRPDITGSSYGEVFKVSDAVAYLWMEGRKRTLEFDPQERFVGKNPADLDAVEIPDLGEQPRYMAELVGTIKAAIGQLSEEAQAIYITVQEHRETIEEAKTCKALTELVGVANDVENPAAQKQVKQLIAKQAGALSFEWDKKASKFVTAKKEETGAEPEPEAEEQEVAA